jgi:hypothetical protein
VSAASPTRRRRHRCRSRRRGWLAGWLASKLGPLAAAYLFQALCQASARLVGLAQRLGELLILLIIAALALLQYPALALELPPVPLRVQHAVLQLPHLLLPRAELRLGHLQLPLQLHDPPPQLGLLRVVALQRRGLAMRVLL